jgi:hypothetical protein
MKTEIISIGSELTTGQNIDSNAQWLSLRLAELGIRVGWHTTVADDLADIYRDLRDGFRGAGNFRGFTVERVDLSVDGDQCRGSEVRRDVVQLLSLGLPVDRVLPGYFPAGVVENGDADLCGVDNGCVGDVAAGLRRQAERFRRADQAVGGLES